MTVSTRAAGRWVEDLPGSPCRWLLSPGWCAFAAGAVLRQAAYDRGWLAIHRLPAPVVAIGNLTAGGTGKTPAVILVGALLRGLGRRPAVVSRGYRGRDGANDEAMLMGDLPVVCDADRVRGGRTALAAGADCVVLDDGFQHRRLHRDLDIVLVDATRPFGDPAGGDGAMLPLGYRREPLSALGRAGLLWISRADLVDPARVSALEGRLAALAGRGVPVVRSRTGPVELEPLEGGPRLPPAGLAGRPVLLASGIGNPAGFEAVARRSLGDAPAVRFADHHAYTAADVAGLERQAGPGAIVVTAKDAVKLRQFSIGAGRWFVLHADPVLDDPDRATLTDHLRRALAAASATAGAGPAAT